MMKILSIHIPKTAGTAFWSVLTQVYQPNLIYRDVGKRACPANDHRVQSAYLVHTHFPLKKYAEYYQDLKIIVWLRNPIFRLMSDYYFSQSYNDRNNPIHVLVNDEELSFKEYIELYSTQNVMTNFIDKMPLEKMFFVGIQEFYSQDIQELSKIMNWSASFKVHLANKNPNKKYMDGIKKVMDDDVLLKRLLKLNSADDALYQKALQMRLKRVGYSALLQNTLAEWYRFSQLFL